MPRIMEIGPNGRCSQLNSEGKEGLSRISVRVRHWLWLGMHNEAFWRRSHEVNGFRGPGGAGKIPAPLESYRRIRRLDAR